MSFTNNNTWIMPIDVHTKFSMMTAIPPLHPPASRITGETNSIGIAFDRIFKEKEENQLLKVNKMMEDKIKLDGLFIDLSSIDQAESNFIDYYRDYIKESKKICYYVYSDKKGDK